MVALTDTSLPYLKISLDKMMSCNKTVTRKIQKHELRAQAIEKLGMRTEAGVSS